MLAAQAASRAGCWPAAAFADRRKKKEKKERKKETREKEKLELREIKKAKWREIYEETRNLKTWGQFKENQSN